MRSIRRLLAALAAVGLVAAITWIAVGHPSSSRPGAAPKSSPARITAAAAGSTVKFEYLSHQMSNNCGLDRRW
jgi:hypothetical protein